MYMMKKICLFILQIGLFYGSFSQTPAKYWVQFKDKNNSEFAIDRPNEFLSPRAIEKRQRFHIPLSEQDLPVNKTYIQQVLSLDTNMILFTQSKWLNGITVYAQDKSVLDKIKALPCVAFAEINCPLKTKDSAYTSVFRYVPKGEPTYFQQSDTMKDFLYGKSAGQIKINNTHWLHRLGYNGKDVYLMILDGGFHNVDSIRHFETLRSENRLLGARNFVSPSVDPMRKHSHGTYVLSCIASDVPGELVGSGPKVLVFLAQTETDMYENKIEEDNWVAGLEWADSLGCDVLNSSLGYTKFDDSFQPRTNADLTGKVSRASQAASIAASKGIIVCNSIGNSGRDDWKLMGCPADASDILAVGGVNVKGERAYFSSYGPTADGRVKPDACAVGSSTYVANPFGKTLAADGTSFSSPMLAGMVCCLRQAFPDKTTFEIMDAIRQSGSQADKPDKDLGYGITDFFKAYNLLLSPEKTFDKANNLMTEVSVNTFIYAYKPIVITVHSQLKTTCTLTVKMRNGDALEPKQIKIHKGKNVIKIKALPLLNNAEYGFVDVTLSNDLIHYHYVIGVEEKMVEIAPAEKNQKEKD